MTANAFSFRQTAAEDPHRARRRHLLRAHPELRRWMRPDARTAAVIVALVGAQLAAAKWIGSGTSPFSSGMGLTAFAYFVGAVLSHWLAMGIHETSHDLALRGARLNRWAGILANLPLLLPSAMTFRRWHLDHHRALGVEGIDNDLPSRWEVRWVGNASWRKALWWIAYPFFGGFFRGFGRRPDRWELVNLAVQGMANVALWYAVGWSGLAYLGLSGLFGVGLHPVAAHWIHEHYLFRPGQETYSYYGPLNWVSFNVGYHQEHHDLMNIPGFHLPKVRQAAPELYASQLSHRSWLYVLWRFVSDPRLGHFSRMTRAQGRGTEAIDVALHRIGDVSTPAGRWSSTPPT